MQAPYIPEADRAGLKRGIRSLAAVTLVVSLLWLVFMIAMLAAAGPLETFEQVKAYARQLRPLFYLTYLNASLIPVLAAPLMAVLYLDLRPEAPVWTAVGVVFVPVYAVFSFLAYASQLTVVPGLVALYAQPGLEAQVDMALRLTLQSWPGSIVYAFNLLAYAVLGIPSIIFGVLLSRRGRWASWSGRLLALNGVACLVGLAGAALQSQLLALGVVVGGVLFILALALMVPAYRG